MDRMGFAEIRWLKREKEELSWMLRVGQSQLLGPNSTKKKVLSLSLSETIHCLRQQILSLAHI